MIVYIVISVRGIQNVFNTYESAKAYAIKNIPNAKDGFDNFIQDWEIKA